MSCLNLELLDLEFVLTAFVAHRTKRLKTPRSLIEEIDSQPEPPPRCPAGKIKINVRLSNQPAKSTTPAQPLNTQQIRLKSIPGGVATSRSDTAPSIKNCQTPATQSGNNHFFLKYIPYLK